MKEIKYIILYLVPVPTFQQVTDPVPVPLVKKLRFLRFRFRFHNTAEYHARELNPSSCKLVNNKPNWTIKNIIRIFEQ